MLRDRIIELRRVPAGELQPHPRNWRTHPPGQQAALRGVLAEIGFANAVLARVRDDGQLELIDGHLRANTVAEDEEVPVLVLDLNETEADMLLAVFDPISAMATRDDEQLAELLERVRTDNDEVQQLMDSITTRHAVFGAFDDAPQSDRDAINSTNHDGTPSVAGLSIPESYQLLVDCRDEDDQRRLYESLKNEGYPCRVLTL